VSWSYGERAAQQQAADTHYRGIMSAHRIDDEARAHAAREAARKAQQEAQKKK
jgi:hypothetical protein